MGTIKSDKNKKQKFLVSLMNSRYYTTNRFSKQIARYY